MKEVTNNYRPIPNCLRKYRKVSGYTQRQVALMLGVRNTGMISRWENGSRLPHPINVFRLAALYGVMADALYIDLIRRLREEMKAKREKLEARSQKLTGKPL